jgi:hypothetical protein
VALGWQFNVFVLIPTIILAGVGITIVQFMHGDSVGSVALTFILVIAVLQIGYLVGSMTHAGIKGLIHLGKNVELDIPEHMEVVGSDGKHVGTVDHTEVTEIVLAGNDPKADGKPHLISVDWVDYVDSKVHLNKPSERAVLEWQIAA